MNTNYSKVNVLLEAVRGILIADTTNTGQVVREIKHYVDQRVQQGQAPTINPVFPMVSVSVDEGESGQLLPTGTFMVNIRTWVAETDSSPNDKSNNLSARIVSLLHKQHLALNAKVASKNLKCRMFIKMSNIPAPDPILQTVGRHLIFYAVCDDENVNS